MVRNAELERKKKYLSRYLELQREIQRASEELSYWRGLAEKVTPTLTGMPRASCVSNKIEDAVIKIQEIEQKLRKDIIRMTLTRAAIEGCIENTVSNALYRSVLKYRYINGMKWEDIADRMHYSIQHIYDVHNQALKEVAIESE